MWLMPVSSRIFRRAWLRLLPILAATVLLTSFQNCGGTHMTMQSSVKAESIGDQAQKLIQKHCAGCHENPGAVAEPSQILNELYLIKNEWVKPGSAQTSPLYLALFAGMPKGQSALNPDDISIIEQWIDQMVDPDLAPAVLVINDGDSVNFNSVVTGSSLSLTVKIRNTGAVPANSLIFSGLNSPFSFKGGIFPGEGGTCLPVIPGSSECNIVLSFSPTGAGTFDGNLTIGYNDSKAERSATLAMRGYGTGISLAQLVISDSPTYTFPATAVSQTADKSVTITNRGSATATGITSTGPSAPFSVQSGTCPASLGPSASCTLILRFAPTAAVMSSGSLSFDYNDGGSLRSVSLALNGTGTGGTGPVYYSQIKAILTNPTNCMGCHDSEWGGTYAQLMAFKKSGLTAAIIPSSSSSRFIARISGTSMGAQMGVPPKGNMSTADRQKIVNWILAGAPNDPITGNATLAISNGPTYDFGTVTSGVVKDQTLTVTNSGTRAATAVAGTALTAPFSFKGGAYPGTGGTCGTNLAPASTCTLVVRFSPSAAAVSQGTLRLSYIDNSTSRTVSLALRGTGVGASLANITISPASPYAFGLLAVGSSADVMFTLRNVGSARATSLSAGVLAAPFRFKGGAYPGTGGTCTASLAAATNCTVVVSYVPVVTGSNTGTVTFSYNDGASPRLLTMNFTGSAVAGADSRVYYSQVRQILNGANCYGCHTMGSTYASLKAFKYPSGLTSPAITPGNVSSRFIRMITTGIDGVKMGDGRNGNAFTDDERSKIIGWVVNGALDDPKGTVTQAFDPLVGDRYYIASMFYRVFGTGPTSQIKKLTLRADVFGGACNAKDMVWTSATTRAKSVPFDDACQADGAGTSGDMTVPTSPVSESVRINTCVQIATKSTYVTAALTGAGLTATSPFDDASVTKAYNRFYPSSSPSPAVLSTLKDLGTTAMANADVQPDTGKTKQFEGWRFIFLTLCNSSGWIAP